jgi:EmrB/QacA subfamily drug resistance transporter
MTKQHKLILVIAILASFVAFLDGSVVNVALPTITKDLGGGLVGQQWVVDAYLITLGSFILLAGSISDIFGRKKVLIAGLTGFAVASILCAIAPSDLFLIISRALQGLAGALLVPSSLALIISTFDGPSQAKAIGTWTGWTGISFIIGPLIGGLIVQTVSWRLIFAINLLPILICLVLIKYMNETNQKTNNAKLDIIGSILCVFGLGGSVFALIEYSKYSWSSPIIYIPLSIGIILLSTFIWYEKKTTYPMLPLNLFKIRNFLFGNLATIAIYAGLSVVTFLIVIFIQQVGGYRPIWAGLSLLPVTIIMFFLSPRFGALAGKYGPRFFMTVGPLVSASGFFLLLKVGSNIKYWTELLPAIVIFGIGLSMTVAPLTSAVLGSIKSSQAGIGSAVNNAISRIAGLIAIAAIGLISGNSLNVNGFHRGVFSMGLLLIIGGIISFIGISNPHRNPKT